MGKETRSNSISSNASTNNENIEQLINKVCANFVKQLEGKFETKLDKIDTKLTELTSSLNEMKETVYSNKRSIGKLENKIDYLEQQNKKNALRFHGFEEEPQENIIDKVLAFIKGKLGVTCTIDNIDCAFRVGQLYPDKPRSILVNFTTNVKRNEIVAAKKSKLKGSEFAIYEDLTKQRYELLRKAKAKYGKQHAWTAGGKIYVLCDQTKQLINTEADL